MKDKDINIEEIKKIQAETIKECIKTIVNKDPEYYKDKNYAQSFIDKKYGK